MISSPPAVSRRERIGSPPARSRREMLMLAYSVQLLVCFQRLLEMVKSPPLLAYSVQLLVFFQHLLEMV